MVSCTDPLELLTVFDVSDPAMLRCIFKALLSEESGNSEHISKLIDNIDNEKSTNEKCACLIKILFDCVLQSVPVSQHVEPFTLHYEKHKIYGSLENPGEVAALLIDIVTNTQSCSDSLQLLEKVINNGIGASEALSILKASQELSLSQLLEFFSLTSSGVHGDCSTMHHDLMCEMIISTVKEPASSLKYWAANLAFKRLAENEIDFTVDLIKRMNVDGFPDHKKLLVCKSIVKKYGGDGFTFLSAIYNFEMEPSVRTNVFKLYSDQYDTIK